MGEGDSAISAPAPVHATLDDWVAREAMAFSIDSSDALHAAIDRIVASLEDSVELLSLEETLHGGEEILVLGNPLFERLVAAHGNSAAATMRRSLSLHEQISAKRLTEKCPPNFERGQPRRRQTEPLGFHFSVLHVSVILSGAMCRSERRKPDRHSTVTCSVAVVMVKGASAFRTSMTSWCSPF
jgi:hypothetical protein